MFSSLVKVVRLFLGERGMEGRCKQRERKEEKARKEGGRSDGKKGRVEEECEWKERMHGWIGKGRKGKKRRE